MSKERELLLIMDDRVDHAIQRLAEEAAEGIARHVMKAEHIEDTASTIIDAIGEDIENVIAKHAGLSDALAEARRKRRVSWGTGKERVSSHFPLKVGISQMISRKRDGK